MSSFTEPLIVEKVGKRTWKVAKTFIYRVGFKDSTEAIVVPKGFITDFASVPRIFWILLPPDGRYSQAAVLHDYLYKIQIYTRKKSDSIFLEAMKVLKVAWWKRWIMYRAVRLACWIPWKKKRRNL